MPCYIVLALKVIVMNHNFIRSTQLALILTFGVLLSACQSTSLIEEHQANQEGGLVQNNAGFLSDYSKLKSVEGVDGQQVLRWVNPEFNRQQYSKLKLAPVVVLPVQTETVDISTEHIQQIQHYFDSKLRLALKDKYQLSEESGSDVLQLKIAITGIELNPEGMKVTEVLPYGAVIGLVRAATGTRNQEVTVILEIEIINSQTRETEVSVVRVGMGENIRMLWDAEFALQNVQRLLDDWALLITTSFHQLLSQGSDPT